MNLITEEHLVLEGRVLAHAVTHRLLNADGRFSSHGSLYAIFGGQGPVHLCAIRFSPCQLSFRQSCIFVHLWSGVCTKRRLEATVSLLPWNELIVSGEKKAIPLQAWTGPWGSRRLWLPEFLDSQHMILRKSRTLNSFRSVKFAPTFVLCHIVSYSFPLFAIYIFRCLP